MDKEKQQLLKNREVLLARQLLKRQNAMLGQSLLHSDQLLYLQRSISLMNFRDIKKVLAQKLADILPIRYFTLFLFDMDKNELTLGCHNHDGMPDGLKLPLGDSPVMQDALGNSRHIFEPDFKTSKYFQGKRHPLFQNDFFVCVPFMIENEIIGALNLNDNDKGFLTAADLDFILNAAEFISLSISNALLFEKVEKLSRTDGLTDLFNRPLMQSVLDREFSRCRRYGSTLSVVILDVDHFKKVNDTYGHQKGDEVLVRLAAVLRRFCRSHDIAARYGGEEFVLILPQTPSRGAWKITERIREAVAELYFQHEGADWQVTFSAGIAEFDAQTTKTPAQLIQVADRALYQAKETGRNRTILGNENAGP